jgi:hypothetical protein
MLKQLLLLAGVVGLLVVVFFYFKTYDTRPSLNERAVLASQNGAKWLLENKTEFSDPGVVWIMHHMAETFCEPNEQLKKEIRDAFVPFESHPTEYAYRRLLEPVFTTELPYEALAQQKNYFDDVLLPVVYCDVHEISTTTKESLLTLLKNGEYETTHGFLALLWLEERNCNDVVQADKEAVAKIIRQELQSTYEFGDLYAEQVAFLQYGGYDHFVTDKKIENIIASQSANGGWRTKQGSDFFGKEENSHTTALAVWALAEYSGTCPFN